MRRINGDFFARPIHDVARDLLGRHLVRPLDGQLRRAQIVEVEVYKGPKDRASHASSGRPTARTQPMFGPPATIYVYQIYGRYQCFNLRAADGPGPGAILVRGAHPLEGEPAMAVDRGLIASVHDYDESLRPQLMSGPAKLCQALQIDTDLSGQPLGDHLWIDAGDPVERASIVATPRVGLNPKTCGASVAYPWRYLVDVAPSVRS